MELRSFPRPFGCMHGGGREGSDHTCGLNILEGSTYMRTHGREEHVISDNNTRETNELIWHRGYAAMKSIFNKTQRCERMPGRVRKSYSKSVGRSDRERERRNTWVVMDKHRHHDTSSLTRYFAHYRGSVQAWYLRRRSSSIKAKPTRFFATWAHRDGASANLTTKNTHLEDAVELWRQFLLALLRGCSTPGRLIRPHAHGVSEQLTNMNDLQDNESRRSRTQSLSLGARKTFNENEDVPLQ